MIYQLFKKMFNTQSFLVGIKHQSDHFFLKDICCNLEKNYKKLHFYYKCIDCWRFQCFITFYLIIED